MGTFAGAKTKSRSEARTRIHTSAGLVSALAARARHTTLACTHRAQHRAQHSGTPRSALTLPESTTTTSVSLAGVYRPVS